MTTESQRYNCFIRNGGNAISKHASPEAKGSNPTTELTLLWAHNPFRGNFNHWQVSRLLIQHVNELEFIITIIIELITLLSTYLLGNLHLSQIVGGIRLSQEKETHP